jgi:phosphate transport system protein
MRDLPHTLGAVDADFHALHHGARHMWAIALRQFQLAMRAVSTRDPGLAAEVLAGERTLNALHVELDRACQTLIARRQPTAVDLRDAIAVLHAIGDLERIGDEAKKIAKRVRAIDPGLEPGLVARIVGMGGLAVGMLQTAADAFERRDPAVATLLGARDDVVDTLRDTLVAELTERIAATPGQAGRLLELIMIVQSIERVADHAEDLAEYVVHVTHGVDARHGNLPS